MKLTSNKKITSLLLCMMLIVAMALTAGCGEKKQENKSETHRQTVAVPGGDQITVILQCFSSYFFSFLICIHTFPFEHTYTDILYHIWYSDSKGDTVFRKEQSYKKCHRTVAGSVAPRYLLHALIVGFTPYGSSKILHLRYSVAELYHVVD